MVDWGPSDAGRIVFEQLNESEDACAALRAKHERLREAAKPFLTATTLRPMEAQLAELEAALRNEEEKPCDD